MAPAAATATAASTDHRDWARQRVAAALERIAPLAAARTAAVRPRLERVLDAFAAEGLGVQHFATVSGYGHGDLGREVLDRVFARVLQAEAAAVRLQFVSGTHAIAAALYGVLRPGDRLLALTGRPYDTLEEVIGIRGSGQGSLAEFGITYDELALTPQGTVDTDRLEEALALPTRMVLIQR
ncbi:MAG: methionine gamma-lyase family protein, partial [Prochlorococcaceae cyanobacterium]